jgi:hypothetical protein
MTGDGTVGVASYAGSTVFACYPALLARGVASCRIESPCARAINEGRAA